MKLVTMTFVAIAMASCSQPATVSQTQTDEVDVLPPHLMEKARSVVLTQAEQEALSLVVDMAMFRTQIGQDIEIPEEVRNYWGNKAKSVATYSSYGAIAASTAGLSYVVSANIQSIVQVVNVLAMASARVARASYKTLDESAEFVLNLPGVRAVVEKSLDVSIDAFEAIIVKPLKFLLGRVAWESAAATSGASVLSSLAASFLVDGKTYIKKSELMRYVMGYDAYVTEVLEPEVLKLKSAFNWSEEQTDTFRVAFANHVINLGIDNDFNTDLDYEIDTLKIIRDNDLGNGRLETLASLNLIVQATMAGQTNQISAEEAEEDPAKLEKTIGVMAATAATLQAMASNDKLTKSQRERIALLLQRTETSFNKFVKVFKVD